MPNATDSQANASYDESDRPNELPNLIDYDASRLQVAKPPGIKLTTSETPEA